MSPLPGFSDNAFQSWDDVLRATTSLLKPLIPYKSPCGARVKLPTATGTGFDEISAQLEGFARPLWVVADLLALRSKAPDASRPGHKQSCVFDDLDLGSWTRGLNAGVDPTSKSFWGHLGNHDQRMVEMEPIAYALLSAPSEFFLGNEGSQKHAKAEISKKLIAWLSSINERVMPPSNWRWFRVLVNLALVKVCGVSYDEVKPIMDADFAMLDSSYIGEGWSSDGVWSEDKKQADYYSGSFAIQYSQLVYIRFAGDFDTERVERYRNQARDFSRTFWRYFDVDGAAIPFGRSLTYRFTFAAFFGAAVAAGVDLPAPLNELGVVKGLLFRHLRWWARKPDFFNIDGTLSIGYTYPNMYMSEDYNSPQSTYWCLKTFAVLALPEDHEFWKCKELPHPLSWLNSTNFGAHTPIGTTSLSDAASNHVGVIQPAMHIICGFPEHHFLLSSGQFTKKTHKAREAKYGKFAYSSAFAFSVPVGNLLEQVAPDSTLSISNDNGDSWKVRWEPINARIRNLNILQSVSTNRTDIKETHPVLVSKWRPCRSSGLEVETILVPTSARWPGWHVRIHKLSWQASEAIDLKCIDSGFAIASQSSIGGALPLLANVPDGYIKIPEGFLQDPLSSLVLSVAGASGTFNFSREFGSSLKDDSSGFVLRPDANTNLVAQRSLIPSIKHHFTGHDQSLHKFESRGEVIVEAWFATGIFAVSSSAGLPWETIRSMWDTKPIFKFQKNDGSIIDFTAGQSVDIWKMGG